MAHWSSYTLFDGGAASSQTDGPQYGFRHGEENDGSNNAVVRDNSKPTIAEAASRRISAAAKETSQRERMQSGNARRQTDPSLN